MTTSSTSAGPNTALAGEFKECRGGDQAAIALVEAPPFRPEIEHRTAPARWRKTEVHRHEFDALFPVARITGPTSLILMSSDTGRSSSLCCVGIPSSRSCIILPPAVSRPGRPGQPARQAEARCRQMPFFPVGRPGRKEERDDPWHRKPPLRNQHSRLRATPDQFEVPSGAPNAWHRQRG